MESLGPLAKLSANKVTYGTMSKIVLDATLSEDRDNSPGELKFIWSCLTSDGSGCFVYDGANPRRLEEALPSGYYLNPISLDGGDISLYENLVLRNFLTFGKNLRYWGWFF